MGGIEGSGGYIEQAEQQVDLTQSPEFIESCDKLRCDTREALTSLRDQIENETNLGKKAEILINNFDNFMSPEQRQALCERYPHIDSTDTMTPELALAIISDPEIGIIEAFSFSGDMFIRSEGESYNDYLYRIESYRDQGIKRVGNTIVGPRGIAIMPGENYVAIERFILPIKDIGDIQNSSDLRNPTVNPDGSFGTQVGGDYLVVKGDRVEAIDPSDFDSRGVQMFSDAVELAGEALISQAQPSSPVFDAINKVFDTGVLGDDIPKPEMVALLKYFQRKANEEAGEMASALSAGLD